MMSTSSKSKVPISLRVDKEILDWFRNQKPRGYQTLIHSVLENHMQSELQKKHWLAGRAQQLFTQYYAQCFWHYDPSLRITPDNISLVVEGLRKHGGKTGLILAEELCQ